MPRRSICSSSPKAHKGGLGVVVQRPPRTGFFCRTPPGGIYVGPAYGWRITASGSGGDKGNHVARAGAQTQLLRLVKAALSHSMGSDLLGPHGDGSCCLHIPSRR